MSHSMFKSMALWSVAQGMRLPQAPIDRLNELGFLRDLLRQLKIDVVLDVGANRGQFASELRAIGYAGKIISFEPVASEFAALSELFERDPHWSGHQIALGSQAETSTITVPKLSVMSSLLESEESGQDARQELVTVRRLDEILPALLECAASPRVFLKMDTQGYDLQVFEGAKGCLPLILGVQSELSIQPLYKRMPHYLEALQVYEAAGFELFNLTVVNRIGTGGLLELNGFLRRPA